MSEQYFTKRQNNLRALIAKEDLDGMLVTNLTHIRYLCGFTGSAGSLLITQDKCEFITDGRYTFQSKNEVKGAKTTITWGSHFDLIKKANLLPSNSNIAFDSNNVSHQIYAQLKDIKVETKEEKKDEKKKSKHSIVPMVITTLAFGIAF